MDDAGASVFKDDHGRVKDEYGRILASTAEGFKTGADIVRRAPHASKAGLNPGRVQMDRSRSMHSEAGSIISYGSLHSKLPTYTNIVGSVPASLPESSEASPPPSRFTSALASACNALLLKVIPSSEGGIPSAEEGRTAAGSRSCARAPARARAARRG